MLNSTAKVVRFYETGGPEVLKLEEIPIPTPGKDEVLLRVEAIGLNRAEVMYRKGQYLVQPKFPSKIGYEASGVVIAVGSEADKNLIGKKFSTVPCFNLNDYGVYGEVAIVPTYALAPYPEKLSAAEATSIWMQYMTAYGALIHYAKITKGDFVIITAASSSVGIAAIEIAKAEGAISIAITRTEKKRKMLLEAGADHVIVTDNEDLVAKVKEITQGKGAGIVFDPVAGKGIEKLAEAAAMGGTIFIYGNLSTEPMPYPLFTALSKGLTIRGYTLFEIVSNHPLRTTAQKYIFDHIQSDNFKPKIDHIFPLAQIVDAHKYMESNEQIGKIVVTV
jgi:NADPH:quinone reductase-like Zn-dependent oxidoreductase